MGDYLPHTPDEVDEMLSFLGMDSFEQLFAHIPPAVRLSQGLDLPDGLSEPDVAADFARLTAANRAKAIDMTCFAGGGVYDHEVPAVVKALANRSEFVTAYTPYQPEVAQGVLQAIFEYQTLVARLSGLPIPNASLYDAATGLVEGLNMASGATGRDKMVISAGVHPHWRAVAKTFARGTGHEIVEVRLKDGVTDWASVDASGAAAIVASYPNYLGVMEDMSVAKELAVANEALFVLGADPVAAGVLKTAGQWGADVFVGEGQPFGTPLAFGGPFLGLFACTNEQVRRLPGRIVGETVDSNDRRSFVTTLRAREQDIRREKATSMARNPGPARSGDALRSGRPLPLRRGPEDRRGQPGLQPAVLPRVRGATPQGRLGGPLGHGQQRRTRGALRRGPLRRRRSIDRG
jgi:glycine dehydrogenase subunit 1